MKLQYGTRFEFVFNNSLSDKTVYTCDCVTDDDSKLIAVIIWDDNGLKCGIDSIERIQKQVDDNYIAVIKVYGYGS